MSGVLNKLIFLLLDNEMGKVANCYLHFYPFPILINMPLCIMVIGWSLPLPGSSYVNHRFHFSLGTALFTALFSLSGLSASQNSRIVCLFSNFCSSIAWVFSWFWLFLVWITFRSQRRMRTRFRFHFIQEFLPRTIILLFVIWLWIITRFHF